MGAFLLLAILLFPVIVQGCRMDAARASSGLRVNPVPRSCMQDLERAFAHEVPLVNAVLSEWVEDLPPLVRPVGEHVLGDGGKRLRPLLTVFTARMLGYAGDAVYTLGAAMETMHAATLLHDDILDNSFLRRGKPSAHTLYGTARVVLAGDALLARALEKVAALGDPRLTGVMAEAVVRTVGGEIAEISSQGETNVSLERYLEIITGKTAWMLKAACGLGALQAGAPGDQQAAAEDFGMQLGIAFQIVDDALDFTPGGGTGKPVGGDLKEGKLTPPLFYYLTDLPEEEAREFRKNFAKSGFSAREVEHICRAVHQGGYDRKARVLAGQYLERALTALEALPDNPERALLARVARFIGTREQ